MPRFEPFAGLRYDPALPLDALIAPPYDVVGPSQRAELAARHRANAIHVELPEPDPERGIDRYRAAAVILDQWVSLGKLRTDPEPTLTIYRMTPPGGKPTTGVIGALGCDPQGNEVLPHEQTIAKDKSDRLDLLRATRTNISPIWGLSLASGLSGTYGIDREPDSSATDDGVRHEMWVISDPATIKAITAAVESAPVVIADGHHRYEVSLTYRAERHAAGESASGADLVMAFIVELAQDQLSVGAIHRCVHAQRSGEEIREAFGTWFDLVNAGPLDHSVISSVVQSPALALVVEGGVWLLTPKQEAYSAAGSDLDSSLVALAVKGIDGASTSHHHSWEEAVGELEAGAAQAAVLLRPVTVEQISRWAHERRKMPPKSTYFFPKPRTGIVFRRLD